VAKPWPGGEQRRSGRAAHHKECEARRWFLLPCAVTGVSLARDRGLIGATPRGQPWTSAGTLSHGRNGLRARRMAVLSTLREPSLGRHVHREFMRSAGLDLLPIIPATACHQRNDVERSSPFFLRHRKGNICHRTYPASSPTAAKRDGAIPSRRRRSSPDSSCLSPAVRASRGRWKRPFDFSYPRTCCTPRSWRTSSSGNSAGIFSTVCAQCRVDLEQFADCKVVQQSGALELQAQLALYSGRLLPHFEPSHPNTPLHRAVQALDTGQQGGLASPIRPQ
jgi:hypothetical protein